MTDDLPELALCALHSTSVAEEYNEAMFALLAPDTQEFDGLLTAGTSAAQTNTPEPLTLKTLSEILNKLGFLPRYEPLRLPPIEMAFPVEPFRCSRRANSSPWGMSEFGFAIVPEKRAFHYAIEDAIAYPVGTGARRPKNRKRRSIRSCGKRRRRSRGR